MAGGRHWTAVEDQILLAAKLTPHTERYKGPHPKESLEAAAALLGRTLAACQSRRYRLEQKAGRRGAWTKVGLWTPDENKAVMAGTLPLKLVAEKLGRTVAAVRTRRFNLQRKARTGD